MTEDEWALPRAKELAQMAFGEDLEEAAGDTLDRNFLHLSSSAHCGKMAALEHLLQLWSSAGNNKVQFRCLCHALWDYALKSLTASL